MRTKLVSLLAALAVLVVLPATAGASQPRPNHTYGEMVSYPMIFPVAAESDVAAMWGDWFYAARADGDHHAQDIMAPKMTPIVAPVAGTIGGVNWSWNPSDLNPERCCTLTLDHDDGWESWYIHLNNDTFGTDDGLAWGIADGIAPGVHVEAGQLLGWVGDSGNAENTPSHLHFELRAPNGTIVNPYEALLAAPRIELGEVPKPPSTEPPPVPQSEVYCQGELATIVGTEDDDVLTGTDERDIIHGLDGDDTINGGGGNDVICGGSGDDDIAAGEGDDRVIGQAGKDTLDGGAGDDMLKGNRGPDHLYGSFGDDVLVGGSGNDRLHPGEDADVAKGGSGNDRFFAAGGVNQLKGGKGKDIVDYAAAKVGAFVDLAMGSGRAAGLDGLKSIERVYGSGYNDVLAGDDRINILKGRDGDDRLLGAGGDDKLIGGDGFDDLSGGDGDDWCSGDTLADCEAGPA